jgi:hypothetical protein
MNVPDKELERLGITLVRNMAEDLVRYGVVDQKGKSDEELHQEVLEYIGKIVKKKGNVVFAWSIDHTPTLLKEARKYARAAEHELSCLFYATWFEHWLNDLINTVGKRLKLTEQEIIQIIRETQFRAKSTWLLRILGLKPINEAHLRRMQSIIDARNSFVHYKWKHVDIDSDNWEKEEQALVSLLNGVEKTVSYLRKLQNKQFFGGRKRKVLPSLSKSRKKS